MKKIGIIGAMELEVETLKSKMNVVKTTKKANMEFFEGTLNGVGVVIVRSGIGMPVSAHRSLQTYLT